MPDLIPYDAVGYFAVTVAILVLVGAIAESLMRRLPQARQARGLSLA